MLNFGWAELMVIGVVALIVIGPDDLPDMFRQLGRFTAKLRSMSREFSRAMDQAAKDSGVKDVANDLKGITSAKAMGLDAVKSAADKFEKWDPIKNAAKPAAPYVASPVNLAKPLVPAPMPAPLNAPSLTPDPDALVPDPLLQDMMDDLAEAGEDLADHTDEPEPSPAPVHGPATQALYDKQAARTAVIAEQTAKLKAIEDGTYIPTNTILPPAQAMQAAQTQIADKTQIADMAATEPKPRTPRKTSKKADTA
ncbi:MAG: twin-arginine translocase subunit TatB [Candidatus Saccharibacteria bacterium]|nr:twin-arginine translocase subunit TatB [Pseudorhodobacter sp.]